MIYRAPFDSIIFDLDGTLWDATTAIASGWSKVAKDLNLNVSIDENSIRSISGLPFEKCVDALFGVERMGVPDLNHHLDRAERETVGKAGGSLYPGVYEGIPQLSKNYELFVVSNCQEWYLESFFKHSGLRDYFKDALCFGQTNRSKKDNIVEIVKRNNLTKPIYVGDTHWDQEAAFRAGTRFLFASFGFGSIKVSSPSVKSFDELTQFMSLPAACPRVAIRKLTHDEFDLAQEFYQSVGYGQAQPSDRFFGAFDDSHLVGLVRLAFENETWVLRGMLIKPQYQFFGIGAKLIKLLATDLGNQECFCLPHGWLDGFYGLIGFKQVNDLEKTPRFLQERLHENRKQHPQLILMRRSV